MHSSNGCNQPLAAAPRAGSCPRPALGEGKVPSGQAGPGAGLDRSPHSSWGCPQAAPPGTALPGTKPSTFKQLVPFTLTFRLFSFFLSSLRQLSQTHRKPHWNRGRAVVWHEVCLMIQDCYCPQNSQLLNYLLSFANILSLSFCFAEATVPLRDHWFSFTTPTRMA